MKSICRTIIVIVLVGIFNSNITAQNWKVKSYLLIGEEQTDLKTWAKNTQDLGNGYSFNTFVLVSDGIGLSNSWGEAVVGIGKTHKNWYFESLLGFQQSPDGIDLMFKPSWGYSKNKFSIFNSWEFGTSPGNWWWTVHADYKVYKKHYIGIMSRRYHGTGLEVGIVIKQFEIHLAQLWDTEIGQWKSVLGLKIIF